MIPQWKNIKTTVDGFLKVQSSIDLNLNSQPDI